jgi:biopolymer transport protein ExbB
VTLFDYLHRGGPIMYILVLANIVSFTIIAWKWMILSGQSKAIDLHASSLWESILKELDGKTPGLEYLKERISHHVHQLENGLNVVKITATTSPLLGLLGTVIGILFAFETISETGLGKPELFASGIAMALITTAGGLLVAIPNSVLYNFLMSKLNNIEYRLENKLVPRAKDSGQ